MGKFGTVKSILWGYLALTFEYMTLHTWGTFDLVVFKVISGVLLCYLSQYGLELKKKKKKRLATLPTHQYGQKLGTMQHIGLSLTL